MGRNNNTSVMVDGLVRFLALGGLLTTAVIAPNAVKLWDKPAQKLFKDLDRRAQEREYSRLINYMQQRGLVTSDDYQHGLALTAKGRQRAERADIDRLAIARPNRWDHKWRIVMFDIPEDHKFRRNFLSRKLRELGFQQLQRSVWIHPFPCREQIATVAIAYNLARYITYIETSHIDASDKLEQRFAAILSR